MKLTLPFTSYKNKLIKNNVRPQIMKLLKEIIGEILQHIGICKDLLNKSIKAQEIKENIDPWDCTKLKGFCTANETINRLKKQSTVWEKIFLNFTLDKRLISNI